MFTSQVTNCMKCGKSIPVTSSATVRYCLGCIDKLFPIRETQQRHSEFVREAVKSDGGPTGYYDFPPGCVTLNDLLEWLAVERWGKFSMHMKDIMKAGFRFGGKEGTEQEYDANKIIYFGCRLLVMLKGKDAVRKYLQKLLDDPQFE